MLRILAQHALRVRPECRVQLGRWPSVAQPKCGCRSMRPSALNLPGQVAHGPGLPLQSSQKGLLARPHWQPASCRQSLRQRRYQLALQALKLVPTGNGSCQHLDREVDLPPAIDLSDGAFEVGREKPVDIVIPVPTVSSHHAMLRIEDGATLTVTDLNSTNGTYVNGKQLQPMEATEVKLKQEVTFGDKYLARFQLQEA